MVESGEGAVAGLTFKSSALTQSASYVKSFLGFPEIPSREPIYRKWEPTPRLMASLSSRLTSDTPSSSTN